MKTIRLLYPDHLGGGLETYYFGANLLAHILPENPKQPLLKVDIPAPNGEAYPVSNGIYAKEQVVDGIRQAMTVIENAQPDKIITIGGDCLVSQAPFDYLHGRYENLGIIWIDTHPDVSLVENGYPNAHAMVLSALLGEGAPELTGLLQNPLFRADQLLYVGLQSLHDYQADFLDRHGVRYQVQTDHVIGNEEIKQFMARFDHILVHFDIDVLDATQFHSTYFANPELTGDGSGSGKMSMEKLAEVLGFISDNADIVGLTIAEYLPFDEHKLHNALKRIKLFKE